MKNKIKIICTLGPNTINKDFLNFSKKNVDLLRLNMSHLSLIDLKKSIKKIKSFCKVPICIDTEGAQIRTKVKITKFCKEKKILNIFKSKGNFQLYPENVFDQIRRKDYLSVGFDNLKIQVISKDQKRILCKVVSSGKLENNKGVHLENRNLKLDFLTQKDLKALQVGKELGIKNYALSFTNSINDIKNFNKILKNKNKIFKIETKKAIRGFEEFLKLGDNFLIDRGDLSKDISIENIPFVQRKLFFLKNKFKKKNIFVATNLLESMLQNNYPTRGEANDIFSSLEMGANGLVLAAETAIGKYPQSSVNFLKKMIKSFKKNNIKKSKFFL
jgi:pyruvate kinase